MIEELAAQGKAILMISSELPEVLSLADRIVVMKGGAVSGTLTREEANERRILELAMTETSKEQIA